MSRTCDICGKGPTTNVTRSHSKIATLRTVHANLQTKRIDKVKKKVCTRCIKTLAKTK